MNVKFTFYFSLVFVLYIHTVFSVGPGLGNLFPGDGLHFYERSHVLIGPVTNLTVLWKGHTNVVVSWLPPQVYINHDVQEAESVKPGDTIAATKMQNHITMVAKNNTGAPVGPSPSGSVGPSRAGASSRISSRLGQYLPTSFRDQFNWLTKSLGTQEKPQWKCRPFSYFGDYTVSFKGKVAEDEASPVVLLKDIHLEKEMEVEIKPGQALVKFEEGCLEHFQVVWQEINNTDSTSLEEKSMLISPTRRTANITALTPGTPYRITVKAQFKAEKGVENHPVIYITTAAVNETEDCECEWPGTAGASLTCDRTPGAKYCTCEVGYEGEFCERCAPGYYRTAPHFPCHECPCNTHGTNRTTCHFEEGFLRCDACETGYTGSMCHICSNGFYRYRKFCVPCHCNGNTPNDANQMCLPATGMCRNCQHNTTGFHCEHCLHGYVGDAKSFKKCYLPGEAPGALYAPQPQKKSGLSPGVVITITLLVLLTITAIGFLVFRRYRTWKRSKGPAFWTVGMSPNGDAVDINSVHNHCDDDEGDYRQSEEVDYRRGVGQSSKYSRLVEDA